MDRDRLHAAVLMGGYSAEREISLSSGRAVACALEEAGWAVTAVTLDKDFERSLERLSADVVFPALHGHGGEDGYVQCLLESLGLSYVGCGPQASRDAFDKLKTKRKLREAGLPVVGDITLHAERENLNRVHPEELGLASGPWVVKPADQGSSFGLSVVDDWDQITPAVHHAFGFGSQVLVEPFLAGTEYTIGILGEQALPVIELRFSGRIFDTRSKYTKGLTDYQILTGPEAAPLKNIQALALDAFRVLGACHLARVDVRCDAADRPYVLEVNTLPGFTSTSLVPKAAAACGINFMTLCDRLARMGMTERRVPSRLAVGSARGTPPAH